MASRGKKKTTMAKLTRESRLRERRLDKQARKDARKYAAANPSEQTDEEFAGLDPEVGLDRPGAEDHFPELSSDPVAAESRSAEG
jgi:hypothetical protein